MKKYIFLFLIGAVLSSCEDYLDKHMVDSIESNNFFKTEADLELYSNSFLERIFPASAYATYAYGDRQVDYLTNGDSYPFLTGNWSAAQQGDWSITTWNELRQVNYFLDNMHRVKASDEIIRHYEGVGRFWRAWFYYKMVQRFGDVPWYDHEINPSDETALYKERDKRDYVMEKVLEDLSYAAANCSSNSKYVTGACRINKWVALAFKSRVCLFEGTYLKYHTELNLENQGALSKKFLEEAVSASSELMKSGPYRLVDVAANRQTQYRNLFIADDLDETEVLLGIDYEEGLREQYVTKNYYSLTAVGESWGFTKQFINTYLTLDGVPFTDKAGYERSTFTDEFKNRDYRLKQTVRYPGYTRTVKKVAGVRVSPDFKVSPTGYQPIKWCLDDDNYDNNQAYYDLPVLRYAEVLLNYAEAKAELETFTTGDWDATIKLLRERAGVKSVYPTQADPYLVEYYMNQTTDKWILEIRRERSIELALEGLRQSDLFRWKLGEMLCRDWYGIYVPALNTEYDLDGNGTKDFSFVSGSAGTTSNVYYMAAGDMISTQSVSGGGFYIKYKNMRLEWDDKKYLRPIPETAVIDNPNLLPQNPGWE